MGREVEFRNQLLSASAGEFIFDVEVFLGFFVSLYDYFPAEFLRQRLRPLEVAR